MFTRPGRRRKIYYLVEKQNDLYNHSIGKIRFPLRSRQSSVCRHSLWLICLPFIRNLRTGKFGHFLNLHTQNINSRKFYDPIKIFSVVNTAQSNKTGSGLSWKVVAGSPGTGTATCFQFNLKVTISTQELSDLVFISLSPNQ